MLREVNISENGKEIVAGNPYYEIRIGIEEKINPCQLVDKRSGNIYADTDYRYHLLLYDGQDAKESNHLLYQKHSIEDTKRGGKKIVLTGKLKYAEEILIKHIFTIDPNAPNLEEQIIFINGGANSCRVMECEIGFRKRIDTIKDSHLVAIPFRYNFGKNCDYKINQLKKGIKYSSEGWAWTNEKDGLLIVKYSQKMVDISVIELEKDRSNSYLRYGGLSMRKPESARENGKLADESLIVTQPEILKILSANEKIPVGTTHYAFYKGGWKKGYYLFRDYMMEKGHDILDSYNPAIFWNDLYNLSSKNYFTIEGRANHTLLTEEGEANIAQKIGCEALYLDPGWDVAESCGLWNRERLGPLKDFIRIMKEKYGLCGIALHLGGTDWGIVNVPEAQFPEEGYARNKDGSLIEGGGGSSVCPQSVWKELMAERLVRIAKTIKGGVLFYMIDGNRYRRCYDSSHGHSIPLSFDEHVNGIIEFIKNIHKECPQVIIECHGFGELGYRKRDIPFYYRHQSGSFDEHWDFEFFRNVIKHLDSGLAKSSYYYNLAYRIPLYEHMNLGEENENCLMFWWVASTCRHIGMGGIKLEDRRFKLIKEALKEYKKLREFYVQGDFYGLGEDEYIHCHTLPYRKEAVINVFNLSNRSIKKRLICTPGEIGLKREDISLLLGAPYQIEDKKMIDINFSVPARSPILAKILHFDFPFSIKSSTVPIKSADRIGKGVELEVGVKGISGELVVELRPSLKRVNIMEDGRKKKIRVNEDNITIDVGKGIHRYMLYVER